MLRTVPLFGRGFKAISPVVSAQQRTNLYIAPESDPDKSGFRIVCTPGLTLFAACGPFPSRGAIAVDGVIYSVHDSVLYRINADGAVATIGTLNTGSGHVSFAWNGTQLMLVDGTDGWIYAAGTLTRIADADFPTLARTVTFFAGRFIVSKGGTGRFHWSALLDGTAWDALDFATAESETDNLVAVTSDHGSLILLGDLTTEFWAPSGDANVFVRVGGAGVEWGCASVASIARFDTGLIWLARNRLGEARLVKLQGYSPVPLDDQDVAQVINAQPDLASATGFSYLVDGHTFYQLNFAAVSLLYDSIGTWQTVSSGTTGGRHLANVRAALSEQPYVFSHNDGSVYRIDKANLSDNETTIVREVVTRHLFADYNRGTVWELYIDCDMGTATSAQAMLQVSRDGGRTYGAELWQSLGALGQYSLRAIWRRLGRARDFTFRLRVTDRVALRIVNAAAQVEF